jgi:UDP-GlcNAc:undecaprenyl-phosphate GlcNAc-1-phosphate transferase
MWGLAERRAGHLNTFLRNDAESEFSAMTPSWQIPLLGGVHLLALLLGYLACALCIPAVIRAAQARGWLDHPGERRLHAEPVPRLGGMAVMAGTALALGAVHGLAWSLGLAEQLPAPLGALLPRVVLGCAIVFAVGVADDLGGVSPRVKLLAQAIAALVVVGSGWAPERVAIAPGTAVLEVGPVVGAAVTLFWVIGVTNAFNLVDGVDGLAGSMAVVAIGTCLAADSILHAGTTVTLSLAILGAVLAFLRANWNPARLFLGDSGSMTLGFYLAVRSVGAGTDDRGVSYPLIPLVALAYPVLDTFTSMARRWVRGHPFSRADGRHIHHMLLALGLPVGRVVQLLALLFAGVALSGVAIVFAPLRMAASLALAAAVGGFALLVYGFRWLGYVEFAEVGGSIASVVRNARVVVQEKVRTGEIAEQIAHAATVEEVHALLADLAEETRVLEVELVTLDEPSRRYGPAGQDISPLNALPVRLDYPLSTTGSGHPLLLRVWTGRLEGATHPAAERVARRLAPVLDAWFAERAAPSAPKSEPAERPGKRVSATRRSEPRQ